MNTVKEKNAYYIQVLDRAAKILDCFLQDHAELRVSEITRMVGLHKSTVHRLLESLMSQGFVGQNPETEKYYLGIKFFELGNRAAARLDIREMGRPVMERLVQETGETANLAVLDQGDAINLEVVRSPNMLQVPSRVGARNPAHCTSVGKALLAYLSENEFKNWVENRILKRYTKNTITSSGELRRELARVRERGFSVNREEIEEGVRAVGAPVRLFTGKVGAAISILGPAIRIPDRKIPLLAEKVIEASKVMSKRMGFASGSAKKANPR